jgi:TetR/AcrR family transcriptional regulator, regulator of cefoperazone and chloramphenicol sensitivity
MVAPLTSDPERRLLSAAAKLFANRGYAETSIRDLAEAADVNVAAVNYHFGDKENLYRETLRQTFEGGYEVNDKFRAIGEEAQKLGTPEAAEAAIRAWVHLFTKQVLDHKSDQHVCLMMRELSDPSPCLDFIISEFMRPKGEVLASLIMQLRTDLKEFAQVNMYVSSILGQCLHYRFCKPVLLRMLQIDDFAPDMVPRIAEHIADFSLTALKSQEREK